MPSEQITATIYRTLSTFLALTTLSLVRLDFSDLRAIKLARAKTGIVTASEIRLPEEFVLRV